MPANIVKYQKLKVDDDFPACTVGTQDTYVFHYVNSVTIVSLQDHNCIAICCYVRSYVTVY